MQIMIWITAMKQNLTMLKNLNILIAEDDAIILDELYKTTSILFKEVFTAVNGQDAYSIFEYEKIDLIITDLKMPLLGGMDLIKKIRKKNYEIPIIILSSFSEQETLLKALNLGVSGYLIKPVEFYELVDILLKAARCYDDKQMQIIAFHNGKLFNTQTKELFFEGKNIELGAKELALLELFLKNNNKTISKNEIITSLWPLDEITDSALKGVLNRLRKKIGEDHIINVKGFGWKFCVN